MLSAPSSCTANLCRVDVTCNFHEYMWRMQQAHHVRQEGATIFTRILFWPSPKVSDVTVTRLPHH
jgi:hypothetical protein